MKSTKAYDVRLALLLLCIAFAACVRPAQAQISRIEHPDTTAGNFFGDAVAVDGGRVVVGASAENVCGENSGAAYIFQWDDTLHTWQQEAKLAADDCEEGRFFGRTVAISKDRVLIGSAQPFFAEAVSNAAYVFHLDSLSGKWVQEARLTGDPGVEEGAFASSVSLDGDRALVTTSGDVSDGHYSGAAYVFDRDPETGTWNRSARLVGSGSLSAGVFGGSGDLEGDRLAVAASTYFRYKPGSVYIFERDPASDSWREVQRIPKVDDFFISLALDGGHLLIGESRDGPRKSGIATLYTRFSSGAWKLTETLRPEVPYDDGGFGAEVSLCGNRALVVGYDEQLGLNFNIDRVVYSYLYDPATVHWNLERVFDIGEVAFGSAIAQNDRWAVIGEASQQKPGAAFTVRLY
ncbi:MAG TPA: FG-GAP repeat protein [Rhodothermales bacterium]|nr:FG-GAP repeat protein [Rhodothermales bacterium]